MSLGSTRSNFGSIDFGEVALKRACLPSAAPDGPSGSVGRPHGFHLVRHRRSIRRFGGRHEAGDLSCAARGRWPDAPAIDRTDLRRGARGEIVEHEAGGRGAAEDGDPIKRFHTVRTRILHEMYSDYTRYPLIRLRNKE